MTLEDKWDLILNLAEKLGINYAARMKWRGRQNVPHKWRYQLILKSDGVLTHFDFEKIDRLRNRK